MSDRKNNVKVNAIILKTEMNAMENKGEASSSGEKGEKYRSRVERNDSKDV